MVSSRAQARASVGKLTQVLVTRLVIQVKAQNEDDAYSDMLCYPFLGSAFK